jgi:hypothetical protein
MIQNKHDFIPKSEIKSFASLPEKVGRLDNDYMLRWYISAIEANEIVIEATIFPESKIYLGRLFIHYCFF